MPLRWESAEITYAWCCKAGGKADRCVTVIRNFIQEERNETNS